MATTNNEYEKAKNLRLAFHPSGKSNNEPSFFSWVLDGKLAGMAFPTSAETIKILKNNYNIGLICSLIEKSYALPTEMFIATEDFPEVPEYLLVDWRDMSIPTRKQMDSLLETTHHMINSGKSVVYHCFGGKGRTGTALCCYLVKYESFEAEQAIEHVRNLRPNSVETTAQEKFIKEYASHLKGEVYTDKTNTFEEDQPGFLTIKLRKTNKDMTQ